MLAYFKSDTLYFLLSQNQHWVTSIVQNKQVKVSLQQQQACWSVYLLTEFDLTCERHPFLSFNPIHQANIFFKDCAASEPHM